MRKFYLKTFSVFIWAFLLLGTLVSELHAQINFNQSDLDLDGTTFLAGVTAMEFGPDGKLYTADYKSGFIKVLTIQKNASNNYVVTDAQNLNGIRTMDDHNDDGTIHNSVQRQITGLTVAGTAVNPIIYVSSSDIRIGAGEGGGNGDVGLDTNSGVITRFTFNGSNWDVVDLVRGLPRSEENHSTNGLQLTTINGVDYLLVASGGFTNAGGPSTNFVYICEYALSGAILSVDLDALDLLPVLSDGGRSYIYDLPTLDDPTRTNVNGITDPDAVGYTGEDINDPFGGNDGLNQAIIVPGGPVQIFSPGYRNAYDLVVTESGALYVTDNGANGSWGGFPVNEGTLNVTNEYDPSEPGSNSPSGGEQINNEDHLQLVTTDLQSYVPGSYYGGHPNPTRANPAGAGLYVAPNANGNTGAVWRTLKYDPDTSSPGTTDDITQALPADWPPLPVLDANPDEGDWRGPGLPNPDGPVDGEIAIWTTNTNPIVEYTASDFGGALKGNLLAGHDAGNIRRVQLNANGTLADLDQTFLSGVGGGGFVLGLTANGDSQIFPGTIWAGTISGSIVVFEPDVAVNCIDPGQPGYDANADYDNDGYTNQDEEDNGTDPCNGGSQPLDFDKSQGAPFISDLNDLDDDSDGIPDALDPFQLGDPDTAGSDAFSIPINNDLFNSQQGLGGIFGLGMTGLMNNGDTGANWKDWLDVEGAGPNPDDVLGGAPGLMTSHMTSGTALAGTDTQEKGYQYGVQTSTATGGFTVFGNLIGLDVPLGIYGNASAPNGELGHFIGDGTQENYIKMVLTKDGITALQEIGNVPQTPINIPISIANRPSNDIVFYFVVDPSTGQVDLEYAIDGGVRSSVGTIMAQGAILTAIQQASQDLAVGFIGTSGATGVELEGTWDFLNVFGEEPVVSQQLPNITRSINAANESIDLNDYFLDDKGTANLTYTVFQNSNTAIGATVSGDNLNLIFPASPAVSNITIRATDNDSFFVDNSFTVTVVDGPIVLYRVNCGGNEINAIDGGLNWEGDTPTNSSQYLSVAGTNQVFSSTNIPFDGSIDQSTTPVEIFASERFDANTGAPNMMYSFPVAQNGNYEVRLYMANSFAGTSQAGDRIFDAEIEGVVLPLLNDIDLSGTYGHQTGTVITHTLKVTDGSVDVSFLHGTIENPLINAIEILDADNDDTPIYLNPVANQFNNPGQALDGSLGVNAFGGDGNLQFSASGLPAGVTIEPTNGQIGGTVAANADLNSPYSVTITVDDSDADSGDIETLNFEWIIGENVWVDKDEDENYTARHECSFVQAGDKFYLMGGRENATGVDVYDYENDTWVNLANSAPQEFNHFQATEYQGLIWIIGAFKDNTFPIEEPADFIWIFDPATNDWIQGPPIPDARKRGSTGLVVYNNKFYIVGGNTDGHDGGYVPWFDEYDPATGIWTPLVDAPRARDHFSAAVIDDKLYLAGGRLSGGPGGVFAPTIAEVDVYDFTAGSWSSLPSGQNLPTPRGGASAVNFNDKLVVIGGEVENEVVYGVNRNDALEITEEYDPVSQAWSRIEDLNHKRHGTQAITSGGGIFILGGSPVKAGGNQKNMEFFGFDTPVGTPSLASNLAAATNVIIADGITEDILLNVTNGNEGIFVKSMQLSGPNAADFSIDSGELTNQLLNANSSHILQITLSGTGPNRSAVLTIEHGDDSITTINVANFDNSLSLDAIGDQNNNEGDVVSLQVQANAASNYSASNLPPTLTINPTTGLISGTISNGGAGVGPFEEDNGLVILEAESGTLETSWTTTTAGGATGIIAGSNHFSTQNGGTIPYDITITTPGVYRFNWRNFYSGSSSTDENDNWLKFPNTNDVWFFGYKGDPGDEATLISNLQASNFTNIVFPKGSSRITPETTPEGNGSNGFFKIFRVGGSAEVYDWQAFTSDFDEHDIYVWFVNPGTYTMEVSERSAGHAIDKMALYKLDGPDYTDGQLTSAPESQRTAGEGASVNSPYNVSISVTDNSSPPTTATTDFIWYVGAVGDPIPVITATPDNGFAPLEVTFTGSSSTDDVGINSYTWDFMDGSLPVTIADPVHTFATPGIYEVQLTVEDTDNNTAIATKEIIVRDPATDGDFRINTGGPSLSYNGQTWLADDYFVGGSVFSNNIQIANTGNDQLYQSERFAGSGNITYQIPVASGDYTVNLHFAELFFGVSGSGSAGGVGSRIFNINIEGNQGVVNNYDIVAAAGGSGKAVVENFQDITVNDGNLTIVLTGVLENPKISGIEVLLPTNLSDPTVYAGDDIALSIDNTPLTLDGSAYDPDGGAIAMYQWTQISGPNTATFNDANIEDPEISGLVEGDYVFRISATDDEAATATDEVTISVVGEPTTLFINSGGPAFSFDGTDWIADDYFNSGSTFPNPIPIANTENDQLYQTERFKAGSNSLIYEIPVQFAGAYNVDLHFAELFFGVPGDGASGGVGSRIFNVDVENGQGQLTNYDIVAAAGGSATAIIEDFKSINVTDGSLTITLTSVVENPKISGIGVIETRVPIVDAGTDQTIALPTNSVTINGTATDPDGGAIVSYQWTQVSGPSVATLTGDMSADLVASNLVEGAYIFRLTATDDENATGFDEIMITVLPDNGNVAPTAVATATPLSGDAPLEVTFTGSDSTDDVGVTGYSWDFKDGNTSTDADPTHTFTAEGTYEVELTVTDVDGLTDMATVTITVGQMGNQAPTALAEATPTAGEAPLTVSFTGSNSSDDEGIVGYAWDFRDGSTSTEADPSHIFTTEGIYDVELTVTDGEGLTGTATVQILVGTGPFAVVEADPLTGGAPLLVNFTGSGSTGSVAITGYSWDFGDGNSSTEADPQHIYTLPGTYSASLTVTDADGTTNTASIDIVVTAGSTMDIILETNPANPDDGGVVRIVVVNLPENVDVMNITVHDIGGRYVAGHVAESIEVGGMYEVPIAAFRNGVYLIRVVMSDGESTLLKLLVAN
ncbi:PKD domain-containing protein [Maribacter sp. 2307UL18-2]|uniref:PKD domain-containing protein n=1 Tax=Maribacter sp. 2307UL18-2 TaxID=3386274 RepID=UPI0039BCA65A